MVGTHVQRTYINKWSGSEKIPSTLTECYNMYAGVKLNFFLGWPIGPAKIWFGWPAISLAGPRYFYRFWSADNNYHILRNRN